MKKDIKKYIEKSEHALEVAGNLLKNGYISDASSKIYYAMFYAAQALLKSEGIDVSKHSAVESALGYYFVKPGKIDKKYHQMLIKSRKIREIADYDIYEEIVEPIPSISLGNGIEFLKEIKRFLGIY